MLWGAAEVSPVMQAGRGEEAEGNEMPGGGAMGRSGRESTRYNLRSVGRAEPQSPESRNSLRVPPRIPAPPLPSFFLLGVAGCETSATERALGAAEVSPVMQAGPRLSRDQSDFL